MPSRMDIGSWGPGFWTALHTAAYAYPRLGGAADAPTAEDREYMKQFLRSVGGVLPCKRCCEHYATHVAARDLDQAVASRENLARFVVDVHNDVNRNRQPPQRAWSYEEARRHWTEDGRGDPSDGRCPAFTQRVRTRVGARCALVPEAQWFLGAAALATIGALAYMLHTCKKAGARRGRRITVAR